MIKETYLNQTISIFQKIYTLILLKSHCIVVAKLIHILQYFCSQIANPVIHIVSVM